MASQRRHHPAPSSRAVDGSGILYYCSCALVPENAASVQSWRDYYFEARVRFFAGMGGWALLVAAHGLFIGTPLLHPIRLVQLMVISMAVVGAASSSPRVHAGIAIFGLSLTVVGSLTVAMPPSPIPVE